MAPPVLEVLDDGTLLQFTFQDLLRYSGPHSPAGVAVAFQAMRVAFPRLEPDTPVERRLVVIETAFWGPGARDGFELVTRSLTEGRYRVDAGLERPERGTNVEQFVFRIGYRDHTVALMLRPGLVSDEFIALARAADLTADQLRRFTAVKAEHARALLATDPPDLFDVD